MLIKGVVNAKNRRLAENKLRELCDEGILDWYELDDRENLDTIEIDTYYDSYVSNDSYLTLECDLRCSLSSYIGKVENNLYGFDAEYLGA